MSKEWPFSDPPNTPVFTVDDVLDRSKPVLHVAHDVCDGGWQFLTGEAIDMSRAKLVGLEQVVGLDASLHQLADLPLGWSATRGSVGAAWQRSHAYPTDWEELLALACANTEEQQARLQEAFSLGEWERFDFDQLTSTLTFSSAGIPRVTAHVQIIGSTSTRSGTWLWSWDNGSIVDSAREYVHLLRQFGEQHAFPKLAQASWPAEEVDGWEMASIACLLLGGQGVYKAPNAKGAAFMVLSDVQLLAVA